MSDPPEPLGGPPGLQQQACVVLAQLVVRLVGRERSGDPCQHLRVDRHGAAA